MGRRDLRPAMTEGWEIGAIAETEITCPRRAIVSPPHITFQFIPPPWLARQLSNGPFAAGGDAVSGRDRQA